MNINRKMWDLDKVAIIERDREQILTFLTYEEIVTTISLLSDFLTKNINKTHICLGLNMSHNIFIPPIILSLQHLNLAFIFMGDDVQDTVNSIGIIWMLSFHKTLENFVEVDELALKNEQSLFIHKRNLISAVIPQESGVMSYSNISYAIKTSGTTGESKIVRVEPHCLDNNIEFLSKIFGVTSNDVIYFGTPLTFDPSLIELFLSLRNGACLLIVSPKVKSNPSRLLTTLFCEYEAVTILQTVPSLFLRWSQREIIKILSNTRLRILAFGGEVFPQSILNHRDSFNERIRVFNLYGITELSCWSTIHELKSGENEIPLGDVIGDTLIEIRNESGEVIDDEGVGEIYLGSRTRKCYLDDETFGKNSPVFRATGDLARLIGKGDIYYLGRNNDVIKRFGHKVNLLKIEDTVLRKTGLISKCVWIQSKLLTFIKINDFHYESKSRIIDKIRIKLLHSLSREEFPDFIDLLHEFPITSHGKLNKRFLEEIYLRDENERSKITPSKIFESLIVKYLGLSGGAFEKCSKNTFFQNGGNSISAIQLINDFSHILKTEFPHEFTSLLFENNLKSCLEFLNRFKPPSCKRLNEITLKWPNQKSKHSKTLKIRWRYDLNACVDATPLIFADNCGRILIALGSFSNIFAIVDSNSGHEDSKFILRDNIEGSACFSQDLQYLYVGCFDCNLYCLDLHGNVIIWKFRTGDRIKSTPSLCKNSKRLVFGSYDKYFYCISCQKGQLYWKTLLDGSIASSPLCDNYSRIYIACNSGTCYCLSEDTGEALWSYSCGSPIFGAPCLTENYRHVIWGSVDGILCKLSAKTGELLWKFPLNKGSNIFSSLIFHENRVIFNCLDGNLYIIDVTENSPQLKFTVPLTSPISSSPFVYNLNEHGDVIVTSSNCGVVYLIDFKEGHIMSQLQLPGEVFSSPQVNNSKVYVGCRDNHLYCIDIT